MTRPLFRSHTEPAPDPLLIFGRLSQAVKHLSRQLAQLPDCRTDYYGTLQTMRAASIALTADLSDLIAGCEDSLPSAAAEPALEVVRANKIPSSDQPPAKEKRGRGRPSRTDPGPKPADNGGHVTLRERVLIALRSSGPLSTAKIAAQVGVEIHTVSQQLWLAKKADQVTDADGLWSVR